MKICVVANLVHKYKNGLYYSYGPYVKEMNIWLRYTNLEVQIIAPINYNELPNEIDLPYSINHLRFINVPQFNIRDLYSFLKTLFVLPGILFSMFNSFKDAKHIHLRCPTNMGLLGLILQILFPNKIKTAKYAGNWDWSSNQPWSYRLQQFLLRNTFLTKNMTALVYGCWPDKTINIKPFFTASYSEKEIIEIRKPDVYYTINLIFAGTLNNGKRPILSLQVLEKLISYGFKTKLVICGDGKEFKNISDYAIHHDLTNHVVFLGNVVAERVKIEMQKSHFLILGSESEGWPKVVAEAMWWGCIPVTTRVSCVPQMLGNGTRGILSKPDANIMSHEIISLLGDREKYILMKSEAQQWARQYTLERFEQEIQAILLK